MSDETTINVPDLLGGSPNLAEGFLSLIPIAQPGQRCCLNLSAVRWVCPYGAVLLLGVCRHLAQLSGEKVSIVSLRVDVHAYLRRIDFFERASGVAFTPTSFDLSNDLSRSAASSNVLELVPINQHSDVYQMGNRVRQILRYWLSDASHDIDRIVSLLAEACSNVVDHSCDFGVVVIQKYERTGYVDVELAISDLGIGIPHSLSTVHKNLSETAAGYIQSALDGLSGRTSGRGGQGLGAIQRIATGSGGGLSIRSETGSVLVQATDLTKQDGLTFFPGTHVAVTFRSRHSLF